MAKKAKGSWTIRATLGEWKQSKTIIWRAQINVAPDGTEFAGVRKFAIKADGTEQVTQTGISLLYDGGKVKETVEGIIKLLETFKGGVVKVGKTKKVSTAKAKTTPSEVDEYDYFVKTADARYLNLSKKGPTLVSKRDKATKFATNKEAMAAVKLDQSDDNEMRVTKVKKVA